MAAVSSGVCALTAVYVTDLCAHVITPRDKLFQYRVIQSTQNICITFCTTSAQRVRRWADVVQILYKCFVFAGNNNFTFLSQHLNFGLFQIIL